MYYRLATAAANWWCKEIKNRYRKLHFGIIDKSFEEKMCLFEQRLTNEIYEQLKNYHYITMGCYYFPDETLLKIAKETNIDKGYLPIHAHLEISENLIFVSPNCNDPYILNVNW